MTYLEFGNAAHEYVLSRYQTHGARVQFYAGDVRAAFAAGAAWQKERDNLMPSEPVSDMAELRIAIGTLGEGMAELMRKQDELQAAGYRGSDRGVAILKHLQEIGDNVRSVSGAIGDKFGVVLDAVRHVGETTEAVLDQVMPQDVMTGTTEPMHAKVKAADYDESGLGKLWADVTVNLEDVSDETLHDLSMSGQIPLPRYVEERARRVAAKIDLGEALAPRVDMDKVTFRPGLLMRDGEVKFMGATSEGFAVEKLGDRVIVLYGGRLYDLRGMDLHPLRFVA